MEAIPSKTIAIDNALREALETHIGLSGEDISFALAALNPNTTLNPGQMSVKQLTRDNAARLLMLLHQKLYTGLRARVFNYIMDWGARRRMPSLINDLLRHIDDGFWELTYMTLTPEERKEIEDTEQLELSAVISAMKDKDAISRLCTGELCKDVLCDVKFSDVVLVPGTFGNFSSIDCFSYSGLIDALAENRNTFSRGPFPKDVIEKYSLDVKLARWSKDVISRISGMRRSDLNSILANLFKA